MKCKECTIWSCHYRTTDAERECVFNTPTYLDNKTPPPIPFHGISIKSEPDWSSFRREAAKDILCAMVSGGYGRGRESEHAYLAIKYADELIKHLKQE